MGFLDFSRFTVTVGTLESAVSTADRLLTFHARCPHEKFTNGSTRFCIDLEQTNKQTKNKRRSCQSIVKGNSTHYYLTFNIWGLWSIFAANTSWLMFFQSVMASVLLYSMLCCCNGSTGKRDTEWLNRLEGRLSLQCRSKWLLTT